MGSRRLITAGVLVVWALLGPLALAGEACAGMGAMCEGPCGGTVCLTPRSAGSSTPAQTASLWLQPPDEFLTVLLAVPELPPKSLRLSA